jgi:hypothetical protein
MVVREDCAKSIPFDVMPYRVFVFKDPDAASPEAIEADIARLSMEITRVAHDPALAVPNPVQKFLAERSAVDSPRSVYLSSLSSAEQEKAIAGARRSISFIGLSSSSCVKPVLEIVEAGLHPEPLHLRVGMLNKECLDGWRFYFNLREGRAGTDEEIEELRSDSADYQNGWIKRMERLSRRCPHFWAFMFDDERIFVGYLAWNKESATGMPVTVLVKSDPATRLQFDYYQKTIEGLLERGS